MPTCKTCGKSYRVFPIPLAGLGSGICNDCYRDEGERAGKRSSSLAPRRLRDYYIKTKGEEKGPYAESQLRSMWGSGAITSDTLFRPRESEDWQPIAGFVDEGDSVAQREAMGRQDSASKAPAQKSLARSIAVLIILLVVLAVMFFGNVHIIAGGHLDSPRIVKKESFGLSETFIKIDTITSMPWIAAKSRYPLSCAVLQREHLIESDQKFRERRDKETKEEMDKALRNLWK
jgi:hypothetical protein